VGSEARGLSGTFKEELISGILKDILDWLRMDYTLAACIRHDYLNIYYRGGSLLKLSKAKKDYCGEFDTQYIKGTSLVSVTPDDIGGCTEVRKSDRRKNGTQYVKRFFRFRFDSVASVQSWLQAVPAMKQCMDFHLGEFNEKDIQQRIFTTNNRCLHGTRRSPHNDYIFSDLEYTEAGDKNAGRADLIGVYWPSTGIGHKKKTDLGLAFFELKNQDNAVAGDSSGVLAHVQKTVRFMKKPGALATLKQETAKLLQQLDELGLLNACITKENFDSVGDQKPEYVFLLANHKPAKRSLRNELMRLMERSDLANFLDIKVATATFLSDGLYRQSVYPLALFLDKFSQQVYSQ